MTSSLKWEYLTRNNDQLDNYQLSVISYSIISDAVINDRRAFDSTSVTLSTGTRRDNQTYKLLNP